jgi:serine/threonine-protein kinase
MGLGAVAAVLAIVAVIALAPWKKTGAAPSKTEAPVVQPVTQPATQPPVAEPPASVATQPEPQQQQQAASVAVPASANANPRVPSRTPGVTRSTPAMPQSAGQIQQQGAQQPAVQQPAVQQQPAAQQPAAPVGPSRAELQEVRESVALTGVRANGIRTSLQSFQRTQAARGMNLRADMQAASNLMNTYLDGAEAALNAGDVVQARNFLDKAEPQIQKLEKFFNIK